MPVNKKAKALVMFSGGLDSRLVIKMLEEQDIDIQAVFFKLPFGTGCCNLNCTFNFSQLHGIPLEIIDCAKGRLLQNYIKMIKKPKYKYGSCMNPCIDCRIYMLKLAKNYMKKIKADFIATGEVLNERPMSQHKRALKIIEKESGLKGLLLRPLSAKLLEETIPEKNKLVDRNKFFGINGRSRKQQIDLAKKYKIDFPNPAGGCLLCDKRFVKKLKNFFDLFKLKEREIELLRIGRHFRYDNNIIITGKDEKDNERLLKLNTKNEYIFEVSGHGSPTTLLLGKPNKEIIKKAAELTARYSDNKDKKVLVKYGKNKLDKDLYILN